MSLHARYILITYCILSAASLALMNEARDVSLQKHISKAKSAGSGLIYHALDLVL